MKTKRMFARLVAAACVTLIVTIPAASLASDENAQKALDVLNALAGRSQKAGTTPAVALPATVPATSVVAANLTGEYVYLGRGVAMV